MIAQTFFNSMIQIASEKIASVLIDDSFHSERIFRIRGWNIESFDVNRNVRGLISEEFFLRIDIKHSNHDNIDTKGEGEEYKDALLEEDLELDGSVVVDCEFSNDFDFTGYIDIILHPTFMVPCAYLQLWNSNGTHCSTEEIQSIVDNHKSRFLQTIITDVASNHKDYINIVDHRHYTFGRLVPEEHPYRNSIICAAMHVCSLEERITQSLNLKAKGRTQECLNDDDKEGEEKEKAR